MKKYTNIISWFFAVLASAILLQTLYFKFSAAPESVWIFTQLHAEPYGRIFSGIMELIASVLILIPRSRVYGALLATGIMGGAILSHIFILGFDIQNDGGLLFTLACTTLISSLILIRLHYKQIPILGSL